ncbi:MAG TPA: ferritin-like domain-containing protein [Polyangiaceae bacterium]
MIVASGCGGNHASSSNDDAATSNIDGGDDGDATAQTGSCPPNTGVINADVPSSVACAIAAGPTVTSPPGDFGGAACEQVCGPRPCNLPQSYVDAFNALNGDGGARPRPDAGQTSPEAGAVDAGEEGSVDGGAQVDSASAGPDAGSSTVVCPQAPAIVTITCTGTCIGGRRTEGFAARGAAGGTDGERLAHMAWLEAVSVHAFERLEHELAAHGAPPSLRRDARRARCDEVRHTAMTTRLARRRGVEPVVPDRPSTMRVRTLVDVAVENAVEGCVRETYGALLAFVEALSSPDPSLRRAMRSIAEDECRHAELAWSVHAWALPRLPRAERKRVDEALRGAAREIPVWAQRAIHTCAPTT